MLALLERRFLWLLKPGKESPRMRAEDRVDAPVTPYTRTKGESRRRGEGKCHGVPLRCQRMRFVFTRSLMEILQRSTRSRSHFLPEPHDGNAEAAMLLLVPRCGVLLVLELDLQVAIFTIRSDTPPDVGQTSRRSH